jgi:hypothetical protein
MPNAFEQNLLRQADVAMDEYDRAQTSRNPAAIASARATLKRVRGELEKAHEKTTLLELTKVALRRQSSQRPVLF